MQHRERLELLRQEMKKHGLDGWINSDRDPHLSEYVNPHWQSRQWLTGFTGSTGTAVITLEKAGLWTDSRYWLQAAEQLRDTGFDLFKSGQSNVPNYSQWLIRLLAPGQKVGIHGDRISLNECNALRKKLAIHDIELVTGLDLISGIWQDRPPLPAEKIILHDPKFTGQTREIRLDILREEVELGIEKKYGVEEDENDHPTDLHIISTLDDIAWLLNIRGSDIRYNPLVISYLAISDESAILFIDPDKLDDPVRRELVEAGIEFQDYTDFPEYLRNLEPDSRIVIDPDRTTCRTAELIPEHCTIRHTVNPTVMMKAIKNRDEQRGIRQCHIRDGVALVRWQRWLEQTIASQPVDEYKAGLEMERFRSMGEHYRGPSFNPIIGYQGNGAIVHYAAQPETAAKIRPEGILLFDSGGQYFDGTTDITRTIALGEPSPDAKRDYTLVLQAHIAISAMRFPEGTTGAHIDAVGREKMWADGKNYGHGTGHGVGFYLNVHEAPQGISPHSWKSVFKEGMLTSNEPGYYREGHYGIRIENLILARTCPDMEGYLEFETVTLYPYDRNLIDLSMLSVKEIRWIDAYHAGVLERLTPLLNEEEVLWLSGKTAALEK